ncbi:TPA: hypothetical protein ACQZIU_000241 [Klebsiella pneumoniae]
MRSNNNEHNKYFSVDAGISSETITKAERLVMERFSHIYANWADEKNLSREAEELRVREIKGFKNILLSPWTLSDVTIEWDYWESVLRHRYKTQNGDGYVQIIWDRRGWLTDLLCVMKPVTRTEALTVCKWLLACDYFEERDSLFDRIILNLVGECEE